MPDSDPVLSSRQAPMLYTDSSQVVVQTFFLSHFEHCVVFAFSTQLAFFASAVAPVTMAARTMVTVPRRIENLFMVPSWLAGRIPRSESQLIPTAIESAQQAGERAPHFQDYEGRPHLKCVLRNARRCWATECLQRVLERA
jgi:hypothetical protein